MFFTMPASEARTEGAIDEYGDSFARDITTKELQEVRECLASPSLKILTMIDF